MENQDFNALLKKKWQEAFDGKKVFFRNNLKAIHTKPLDGGYIAYFNLNLVENKRETQLELGEQEEIKVENKDHFTEKIKTTASNVYRNFNEDKFNFNQVDPNEILFYVNLDEEAIITKEEVEEQEKELDLDGKELNQEISETSNHPVLVNVSPICANHSIIPLFPREQLPQVIGQDMIVLLLQVFKMSNQEGLRVGYNSVGAFASVNHLHFQLLYIEELFKTGKFPIEQAARKEILQSKLQSLTDSENQYNTGIVISELKDYPAKAFVVSAVDKNADIGDIFTSVSFGAGLITSTLLDNNIPHNIMIADKGTTIYVIPRVFEKEIKDDNMRCAWLEACGLAICRNKKYYEHMDKIEFEKVLKSEVSIEEKEFERIKGDVVKGIKNRFKP